MKYHIRCPNRLCLLGIFLCSWMVAQAQTATEAWVRRYNSEVVGSHDYALKIVTDTAGNAIVAGYTDDGFTGRDILVIKYSGAGVPLWTNRYNGPHNGNEQANAVAVDGSGNVFVAGNSTVLGYSNSGMALWTNRYGGEASALAADSNGNVFVTGTGPSVSSGGTWDYMTVAYSGTGVALWTNHYSGPVGSSDDARALAVDNQGHVFVTGHPATVGYSGTGVPLWTNRFSGWANAVAVGSDGNVLVTGYAYGYTPELNFDYQTVAYSGAGAPLWTNLYGGQGHLSDRATGVVLDSSGNVFVTGYSVGASFTEPDCATIAYSGAGAALWTNHYNGPGNGNDQASAMALSDRGTVFVTGSSPGLGGFADYVTIAYSEAGVPLWTNRHNGLGNGNYPRAVAVNSSGNVFVTGSSYRSGFNPGNDYATIAYSGAGVALWTNRYNGPDNSLDNATAVAVDGSGNVFVTGSSANTNGNSYSADYATIAYSGAGMALWTNRYKLARLEGEPPTASLAVGRDGALYLTGGSLLTTTAGSFDYTTVKYVWRNQLVIQPFTAGASTVNLMLSGNSELFLDCAACSDGYWSLD